MARNPVRALALATVAAVLGVACGSGGAHSTPGRQGRSSRAATVETGCDGRNSRPGLQSASPTLVLINEQGEVIESPVDRPARVTAQLPRSAAVDGALDGAGRLWAATSDGHLSVVVPGGGIAAQVALPRVPDPPVAMSVVAVGDGVLVAVNDTMVNVQGLPPHLAPISLPGADPRENRPVATSGGDAWVLVGKQRLLLRNAATGSVREVPVQLPGVGWNAAVADGTCLWATRDNSPVVYAIRPNMSSPAASIPVADGGNFIDLALYDGVVWAASSEGTVSRIDARSGRVTNVERISRCSADYSVEALTNVVWVTDDCDASVFALDPRTGKVTRRLDFGKDFGADRADARFRLAVGTGGTWLIGRYAYFLPGPGSNPRRVALPSATDSIDSISVALAR